MLSEFLPRLYAHSAENAKNASGLVNETRRRFQHNAYDREMSTLHPDLRDLSRFQNSQFYDLLAFYNRDAIRLGCERWGFKYQPIYFERFRKFMDLAKTASFIFIYRDIVDVASSFKSRWGFKDLTQLSELAERWNRNYQEMKSLLRMNVRHLEYEELCLHAEPIMTKICQAFGLPLVNMSVFQRKINVTDLLDNLTESEKSSEYRPPTDLSQDELLEIERICGPTRRRYGYPLGLGQARRG